MSKISAILGRNFRLIFRSKASAAIILLGPIFIMLAIGLAFNTGGDQRINIGYVTPDDSSLVGDFISLLQNDQFSLQEYEEQEVCRQDIGLGKRHICIVFPSDFRIANDKVNKVDFLIDNSKVNFFSSVVDSIETQFNKKAQEISAGYTEDLLQKLNSTSTELSDKTQMVAKLKEANSRIANMIKRVEDNIEDIDTEFDASSFNMQDFSYDQIVHQVRLNAEEAFDIANDLRDEFDEFYEDACETMNCSEGDDAFKLINSTEEDLQGIRQDLYSGNDTAKAEFEESMEDLDKNLENLDSRMEYAGSRKQTALDLIGQVREQNVEMLSLLEGIEDTFSILISNIESTELTDLESIVSPIEQNVRPVVAEDSQLNFYFPYLLVLIISFIGILLGSSLIIMDKTSMAYFRNFVTPTEDSTFLLGIYMTTFIILAVQITLILTIFSYYFHKDILTNLPSLLTVIFFAVSIFTCLGMILGTLVKSEETGMLASIFTISTMIFISDLIFPIERMPAHIATIAESYNPFFICSDVLRMVMVHKIPILQMQDKLALLVFAASILVLITLFSYKFNKKHIILRFSGYMARRDVQKMIRSHDSKKAYEKMKSIPESKYFVTKDKKKIKDLKELYSFIEKSDFETFSRYVKDDQNLFADWISDTLGNEPLGMKMYKTALKGKTLRILDKAIRDIDRFEKKELKKDKKKKKKHGE